MITEAAMNQRQERKLWGILLAAVFPLSQSNNSPDMDIT
jgi:hypothetical protein